MNLNEISENIYKKYIKEDLQECDLCYIKLPTVNFYYFDCGIHNYCQYCCCKILNFGSMTKCPCCRKVDYNLFSIVKKNSSLGKYYYDKGCDFYDISKYNNAINLFNKSIMYGNIESFFKLANCYFKKNDINKYVHNLINYLFKSDFDKISDFNDNNDINGNKFKVALFLSNFFLKNEYNIEYSYFFNSYLTETLEDLKEINEDKYNYYKKCNILLNGYINYLQLENNYKNKEKNIIYLNKINDIVKEFINFFEYKYNTVDIINIEIINHSINIILSHFNIKDNFDEIYNLYYLIDKYFYYICNYKIKVNNTLIINIITTYINYFKKINFKLINNDKLNKIIKISDELYNKINKSEINKKSEFLYDLSVILSSLYLLKSNDFNKKASGLKRKEI